MDQSLTLPDLEACSNAGHIEVVAFRDSLGIVAAADAFDRIRPVGVIDEPDFVRGHACEGNRHPIVMFRSDEFPDTYAADRNGSP